MTPTTYQILGQPGYKSRDLVDADHNKKARFRSDDISNRDIERASCTLKNEQALATRYD